MCRRQGARCERTPRQTQKKKNGRERAVSISLSNLWESTHLFFFFFGFGGATRSSNSPSACVNRPRVALLPQGNSMSAKGEKKKTASSIFWERYPALLTRLRGCETGRDWSDVVEQTTRRAHRQDMQDQSEAQSRKTSEAAFSEHRPLLSIPPCGIHTLRCAGRERSAPRWVTGKDCIWCCLAQCVCLAPMSIVSVEEDRSRVAAITEVPSPNRGVQTWTRARPGRWSLQRARARGPAAL